jgi:hypothetical protein
MPRNLLRACASLYALTLILPTHSTHAAIKGTVASSDVNPFNAVATGGAYRYGPSIIMNGDGTGDAWFCGPGPTAYGGHGGWDNVWHMSISNNGQTWTNDTSVLWPSTTGGTGDGYSTCDPGAIYFGGYYYIGYTSTTDINGTNNQVFLARATTPTGNAGGGWDKWNGSGWDLSGTTQNPQPFITYTDWTLQYGAGEPSFVINSGTLYVYYSYDGGPAYQPPVTQTRVATTTAYLTNPNWPATLTYQGVAMDKTQYPGSDSADVKYVDAYGKFLAITSARRFGPSAYLQFWESTNGINFTPSDINANAALPYLHNTGLSGDTSGHINASSSYNFVAYADGPQWANWNTDVNPVTYANSALPAPPRMVGTSRSNGAIDVSFTTSPSVTSYTLSYGTQSGVYTNSLTGLTASSPNVAASVNVTGLTNGVRYYFSTTATNSNGTSEKSEEIYDTPENYVSLSISNSASSSVTGSYVPANTYNGSGSFFSSKEDSGMNSTEWISWDLGSPQTVARMTFTDRPFGLGGPVFGQSTVQIQASLDGSNWFAQDYLDNFANNQSILPTPVVARYIRLYANQLNPDDAWNYYLQLAKVLFENNGASAIASSNLSGWESYHLMQPDVAGNTADYSSVGHTSGNNTEWVELNLGQPRTLTGINVTPRPTGIAFPVAFTIQYSNDGVNMTNIPGQTYASYPNPGSALQQFRFSAPITAQFFRVVATQLGADQYGNYYLQLAHMDPVYAPLYTLTASSSISGWGPASAGDGNPATSWSSSAHASPSSTEWIQLDFGSTIPVSSLRLIPRQGYCFPSALNIQYSTDNVNWTQAPGQNYPDFYDPAQSNTVANTSANPLFVFKGGISARYIRIVGTALRPDQSGNYYFQLQDIIVNPDGSTP